MFWDKIFKKLINTVPKSPEYDQPLGLRIGAAVKINLLDFKIHKDKFRMTIPESDTLIIKHYGVATLDGLTKSHYFYSTTGEIIRVSTENNEVKEINLFTQHDVVYPSNQDDWDSWIGKEGMIGNPVFELIDKTLYERAIFEENNTYIDPVNYKEVISIDANSDSTDYIVEHLSMPYARFIDEEENQIEWLILDAIDTGESAQINLLLGITLEPTMFEVI